MTNKKPTGLAKIWREIKRPFKKKISNNNANKDFEEFSAVSMLMILSKLTGKSMLRVEGIIHEYKHWDQWFAFRGIHNKSDKYGIRLVNDSEVDRHHSIILDELCTYYPISEIKILDVGAGPLTSINKLYKGNQLNITAIDAIADYYDNLLKKYGIDPPVRTQVCEGEQLSKHFSEKSFHWIHARNSLDHMENPIECIMGMLPLLKPHGIISLFHQENVANLADFQGFHQWNFFKQDNDFCISGRNKNDYCNVTKTIEKGFSVQTSLSDWEDNGDGQQLINVEVFIRPRTEPK
ncbi:MAG: methyltransferase domain-containing protein [Thermoguttaceae bacterium]